MKKNLKEKRLKQNLENKGLKQKKGITLIALIITIIVLLILAGVSVAMLAGENGILKRAVDASETTKESNAREKVELAVMESIDEKGKFNVEKFKELIEGQNGYVEQDGENFKVEMDGYEVTVDAKTGKIKEVEKSGGIKAKFETKLFTKGGGEPLPEGQEELVLTVNVTNKEEIGEGEIKVTVTAPNGENVEANAEVTGEGYKSFKVDQNGEYTVTVEITVGGVTKKATKKVQVNSIRVAKFSREYGTIDIRFINGTGDTTAEGTEANVPVLGANMTPVNLKSDNSGWEETTKESWNYSYKNTAGESKWANAVVKDATGQVTGYFVWIPRYAYKITYHSGSIKGETVGYSDSRGIVNTIEGTVIGKSDRRNAGDNFIVHPAFTNARNVGGWVSEVQGIWVAKYEASGSISSVKVLPGKPSLMNHTIGDVYTASENYNKDINSHLMKNSEWGACAYLSYSNYGIGANTKIVLNNSHTTGGNNTEATIYTGDVGQSTTGNAYGVYDMHGGASEYVASYINSGVKDLSDFGNSFTTTEKAYAKSNKKVTVYKASNSETKETSDDEATNYKLSEENMFGDAIAETSTPYSSSRIFWQGGEWRFPSKGDPFFSRGGGCTDDGGSLFRFSCYYGGDASNESFRLVLVP